MLCIEGGVAKWRETAAHRENARTKAPSAGRQVRSCRLLFLPARRYAPRCSCTRQPRSSSGRRVTPEGERRNAAVARRMGGGRITPCLPARREHDPLRVPSSTASFRARRTRAVAVAGARCSDVAMAARTPPRMSFSHAAAPGRPRRASAATATQPGRTRPLTRQPAPNARRAPMISGAPCPVEGDGRRQRQAAACRHALPAGHEYGTERRRGRQA